MPSNASPSEPLVSVIMPCYNAEAFVSEAVASVFDQGYANVELIAVDDGSRDGTLARLGELERLHGGRMQVYETANEGPYPARNLALRHARGELLAFLDADDLWDRRFLEALSAPILAGVADLTYCGWRNFGIGAPGVEPYVPPRYEADPQPVRHFLKSCPWPIHAALIRRSAVEAIGGFSTRCFSSMDYDFWIRLWASGARIDLVPEVLAFYRWHDQGQISKTKWKQVLDGWRVRKDFLREHPDLVAPLGRGEVRGLVYDAVLQEAYRAYWSRDLVSARILFRKLLLSGYWRGKDMKYLLPSLLPSAWYDALVHSVDRRRGQPMA